MKQEDFLHPDLLSWLLEVDQANPGVRYFTLRDLLKRPIDDPEVVAAQMAVMQHGTVPAILAAQAPEGYWVQPKPLYYPKYRGTFWSVMFLAQLGADGSDPRVQKGCEYVLQHGRAPLGGFSANGTAGGVIQCLEGNLCAALIDLGWMGDGRLDKSLDWLARSITGEGIASSEDKYAPVHYLVSANCGPNFACSANNRLPCAWGAVKSMQALARVPAGQRTPSMQAAVETGIQFLLSRDPAVADYPMGFSDKPSRSWFQFGFPLAYVTDILQILEGLCALGFRDDPRLKPAFDLLLSKRDAQGRWLLEYSYNGKTWADIEAKGKPSKWVTLRALRVLS